MTVDPGMNDSGAQASASAAIRQERKKKPTRHVARVALSDLSDGEAGFAEPRLQVVWRPLGQLRQPFVQRSLGFVHRAHRVV